MKKLFISFLTASMLVSSTVVSPSVFNMNGYTVSAAESITIISQPSDFYAVNKAPVISLLQQQATTFHINGGLHYREVIVFIFHLKKIMYIIQEWIQKEMAAEFIVL